MTDLVRPILAVLETAHFSLGLQLGDLEDTDARRRARGDEGSSISWIVGHLLSYRCMVLQACGVAIDNPYEKRFAYDAPAGDGTDDPPIAELAAAWNDIHGRLVATLRDLDDETLLADSSLPSPGADRSLLAGLAFCQWHEAYHIGVVGMLRVQWGYRHTHELAMEAMS